MRQQHQHVLNERTLDSRLTLKLKTLNKKKHFIMLIFVYNIKVVLFTD